MDKLSRKELIKNYKEIAPRMGVFCIKNLSNGKVFLASSKNLHGIIDSHKIRLNNNMYFNTELQNDWNALGEKSFKMEILEELKSETKTLKELEDDLEIIEAIWVENFSPLNEKTYNKSEKIRIV